MSKLIKTKQHRKLYRKSRLVYFVVIPLLILGLAYLYFTHNYLINTTDSMAVGLYKKLPVKRLDIGDTVGICLDNRKADLAIANNIITYNHQCPNGSQMLIKEIIAVPGDEVYITQTQIKDHHGSVTYKYNAPRFSFSPRTHQPVLTFIDLGKYESTGYWLYGQNDYQNSWDSRYFGQVPKEEIMSVLKPVWIWSNK